MGDKGDEERAEGSTTRQKGGQDKQEHQKQEQQQQQEEAPEDHGADIMRACESLHRATVRLVQLNGASSRPGVLKCFGLPRLQLLAGDVWNQKGATGGGGGGCEESMWRELHQLERGTFASRSTHIHAQCAYACVPACMNGVMHDHHRRDMAFAICNPPRISLVR